MLDRLPEFIDPLHLADKRGALKGQLPISKLDRLADLLHDNAGAIAVDLFFEREGRLAKIEGKLEGVLVLKCQNCLEALEWPINHSFKLGIIISMNQVDKLPEDYEPLLVVEDNMPLKDIVEDELLLALPTFPKHRHDCLAENLNNKPAEPLLDSKNASVQNPFSILATLKNTGDL